jgi:hypothetical protein
MITKDLIENVSRKKYFLEHELLWLFDTETIPYSDKIDKILEVLAKIYECDTLLLINILNNNLKNPKINLSWI